MSKNPKTVLITAGRLAGRACGPLAPVVTRTLVRDDYADPGAP